MKQLIIFVSSSMIFLIGFNLRAITIKYFKANYIAPYRQKSYQTKLDLVKAYENSDTTQHRQTACRS